MPDVLARLGRLRTLYESGRITREQFEDACRKTIMRQPVDWQDDESNGPDQNSDEKGG